MIVELEGIVKSHRPGYVVLQTASGVGWGIDVPQETEDSLPRVGETVHLYTHLVIREDQWRLIGFASERERLTFLDLIGVNGVGIKAALSLMSHLGLDRLRQAVLTGEWKALQEAPGIGAKIAQRVQLEMSGRWSKDDDAPARSKGQTLAAQNQTDEVLFALVSLGYGAQEAQLALDTATAQSTEERLRQALKALDRGRMR